jgi:hypothetical protein
MRHILRLLLFALASGCGGPLPTADTPTPPVGAAEAAARSDADAPSTFHTITVTLCAKDVEGCRNAQSAAGSAAYRIAFGSSLGTLRTRSQAEADLYREVRDRTTLGTHLAAHARHLEAVAVDAGGAVAASTPHALPESVDSSGTDVLIDVARTLLAAVDTEGEVTFDVSHARPSCKLSLTAAGADASWRCLVREPSHPGAHDSDDSRRPGDTRGLK